MRSRSPASELIKHPIILGGISFLGLLLIAAGVLTMMGTGGDGGDTSASAGLTPAPTARRTTTPTGDTARTIRATSVYSAPSHRNPVFGTLPGGAELDITGRNADASWFEIQFPSGSSLRGWVDSQDVRVPGDSMAYAPATPASLPIPDVPTLPAGTLKTPIAYTPEPEPTLAPTTPTPSLLPDLVISGSPAFVGGALTVTVSNVGAGIASGSIEVAVYDGTGQTLLVSAAAPVNVLPPGGQVSVNTGFRGAAGISNVLVLVNPGQGIAESDYENNGLRFSVSVNPPTSTPEGIPPPSPEATASPSPPAGPTPH